MDVSKRLVGMRASVCAPCRMLRPASSSPSREAPTASRCCALSPPPAIHASPSLSSSPTSTTSCGAESDADEEFVADLHARLSASGCPLLSMCRTRLDVAARARAEHANLEALARRERYRWLAEVARAHEIRWIVTGHTANDQAETVLHRLLRGTGLRGLRGIAPYRELGPNLAVVRPLLSATREEIIEYLRELGQPYREDRTNDDPAYTRNRIRHQLLPLLARTYNPAIVGVLARLAEQAEETYRIEEAAARALLSEVEMPRAGSLLIFDSRRLMTAPRIRVREMFRLVWMREDLAARRHGPCRLGAAGRCRFRERFGRGFAGRSACPAPRTSGSIGSSLRAMRIGWPLAT